MATALLLPTVQIGTQQWSAKNLDVSKYTDGTIIPQVTNPTYWKNLTTGAWCYYKNDPANGAIYGKLYNWYAVAGIWNEASKTDTKLRKKLAPVGYHIPSSDEFFKLLEYVTNETGNLGDKLRETGIAHWDAPNNTATNSSGFTALPAGAIISYLSGPQFTDLGKELMLWSSTVTAEGIETFHIEANNDWVWRTYLPLKAGQYGYSVRVLVDPIIDPACTFAGNMTVVYPASTTSTTTKKLLTTTTTTKKLTTTTTTTKKLTTTTTTTKKLTTTTTTTKKLTTTTTTKAKICTLAGKASVVLKPVVWFSHSLTYGTISCNSNSVVFNASGTIVLYSSSKTLIPGISLWQNKELTVAATVNSVRSIASCWNLNGNTLGITTKIGGSCSYI
jgi:uncharacterized protein (TIGR02145 family)